MKILVACEFSGTVRDAFSKLGHDAWSCDLLPTESELTKKEGKHIQDDVLLHIDTGEWDMMIAHPPCTYLTITNNRAMANGCRHYTKEEGETLRHEAILFFLALADCPIPKICIENPIGIMSKVYRKPDQIIQPYYFGDEAQKTTCLWLKGLPKLQHFKEPDLFQNNPSRVGKGEFTTFKSGRKMAKWYADTSSTNSEANRKIRNATFPGIAKAFSEQWSNHLLNNDL